MRSETSCIALLGTAGVLTLGLGLSTAESAPVFPDAGGQTLTETPIPVVDAKAGADAGAGAGTDGAGASAGADVGGAGGDVGADAGAGTDAGGDTSAGADAGADTGADTNAGGDTSAGADAGSDASAGAQTDGSADTTGDTGADAPTDASSNATAGESSAPADTATPGETGAAAAAVDSGTSESTTSSAPVDSVSAAPSAGTSGANVSAPSQAPATPAPAPLGASATIAVPASSPVLRSSPSLPLVSPGVRQGETAADANRNRQTQPSEIGCVDRLGYCPSGGGAELGALPQTGSNNIHSGISGVSNGAARLPAPVAATPTRAIAAPAPQPAARTGGGLGISLVDPMRKDNGLVVQGVIVNTSTEPQAIPAMQISLLNSANQVVQRSVVKAPGVTVAQGQHKNFKTFVQPLPPNIARVTVAFIANQAP